MRYRDLLMEDGPDRTLYHGTLIRYVPDILEQGLWPSLGDFTRDAYAENEEVGDHLPDLVFAADKEGLRKCVSAIYGQMRVLKINWTPETFRVNAALLILRGKVERFSHRYDQEDENHPVTVEPEDYYTDRHITVDAVLTGAKLIRFLRRFTSAQFMLPEPKRSQAA